MILIIITNAVPCCLRPGDPVGQEGCRYPVDLAQPKLTSPRSCKPLASPLMARKSRRWLRSSRAKRSKTYLIVVKQLIKNGLGKVGSVGGGAAAPAKAEKKEDKKAEPKKEEKKPEPKKEEPPPADDADFGAGDLFGDF